MDLYGNISISSKVDFLGGVPTLFINGKPYAGMAYITYNWENACYRSFADAGYRLFSLVAQFGDRFLNTVTGIHQFSRGFFAEKGKEDYSAFDTEVHKILDACPDALIFPRVNMGMPRWWDEENPDECCDTGYSEGRRGCFSSRKWREDTKMFLRRFISHVCESDYAEHIFGYQIADGNTEEWFSWDQVGSNGKAARKGYAEWQGNDGTEESFRRYLSVAAADAIREMAEEAKALTGGKVVVGSFYGYLFEVPFWKSNHHALQSLLHCKSIDFLCSPAGYTTRLMPGLDWPCMVPEASMRKHGKLYFAEFDSRTCLTRYLSSMRPEIVTQPKYYDTKFWLGPETEKESIDILRMNFARQYAASNASWWFDMWGGWYESPAMMAEMKNFHIRMQSALSLKDRTGIAECAAWVDETSFPKTDEPVTCCRTGRISIGQSGIPCDYYELADFPDVCKKYKMMLFFVPARTEALEKAEAYCGEHGIPFMEIVSGSEPTADAIRETAVKNHLHCWTCDGDSIHACRDFVGIHAASDGRKKIFLPKTMLYRPTGSSEEWKTGNVLEIEMNRTETALFDLKETEK